MVDVIVVDRGRCKERDENKEEKDGGGNGGDGGGNGGDGGEKSVGVLVAPPRIGHEGMVVGGWRRMDYVMNFWLFPQ